MGKLSRFSWVIMIMWLVMLMSWFNCSKTYVLELVFLFSSSVKMSLQFVVDPVSMLFGSAVFLISGCVFLFACDYMKEDPFFWRFMLILFSFVMSMNLLIFSGSLFSLLLGWDGLGISSFALIIYYQSRDSLFSGFHTLLINRLGDVLIMVGSFYLLLSGDYSNLFYVTTFSFLVIYVLASLTKSAQYPFSSWLPAAMAAPTPVSALVHSSTLVTAGIYLIIRFSLENTLPVSLLNLLLLLGSVTSLLGGWCASVENDLKKIIALSTLSQLGVMIFSLGLGLHMLAFFHLLTHAMFKALLFLCGGILLQNSYGSQDVRLLGGTSSSLVVKMIFNVSGLCLVGAPFMSSFYSKHAILDSMMFNNTALFSSILMILSGFFTARYVARLLRNVSFGVSSCTISSFSCSYCSMISVSMLGIFSLTSGWMMVTVITTFQEFSLVPGYLTFFINMGTMLGGILGFTYQSKTSMFLTSMFFLSPLFLGSYSLMKLSKNLKVLDSGWLEPVAIEGKVMNSFSFKTLMAHNWPMVSTTFSFFVFLILMLWYLFLI